MKLAIIDIIGIPYDGNTVDNQGLGGSESAVTLMSRELNKIGFSVTVFNNCGIDHARAGNYDGVVYRPLNDLVLDHDFDVVISSRTVIPFTKPEDYPKLSDDRAMPFQGMNLYDRIVSKAKMRILWMHDTFCLGDNLIEELAVENRITDVFTLSDFHLTYIANCHHGRRRNFEVLKRKLFITRNGARNYRKEIDINAKDPNLFVYNASVTKGMVPLIRQIWPRVKSQIPNAKLKVIGGYYRFSENSEPDQQEKDWRIMSVDPRNQELGIEYTGVISQKEIADILTSASYMIYPALFPETFGISSLESLLYNTPIITCRFGALEEIALEGACYLIDYAIEPNGLFPDINIPDQIDKFVNLTIQAYHNKYLHQQKQYYCNIIKDIAGWDSVALQWKQFIVYKLGGYLPRDEYRAVSKINHKVHKVWNRRFTNTIELENYKSGNEQKITIISPFYNCASYITRCIISVATQDYDNYQHILIDDASTDNSVEVILETLKTLPDNIREKFTVISNHQNLGAVRNQIQNIRTLVEDDSIVMLLDGDDSLISDNTILSYYNSMYDGTTEFTYGSCWSMVDNIPLISQPYPDNIKQNKLYRDHHFNWILPYTHLRTFKKYLLNNIEDSQFQDLNGNWYKAGGDGSVFYALIEAADPNKVKCIQDIVYNYNDASPLNDYKINGNEQTKNARDIVNKNKIEKYSIIIPTMWRVAEQFVGFLQTLCDCPSVDDIIIIDNDSDQRPLTTVFSNHKIRILNFGKNIYVNPAWNIGVKYSKNDRICIVNDDVTFDTKVFIKLQGLLSNNEGIFGLYPGVSDFNQIPVTTKTIDIIPWTGQHTYGFGCLMFMHKDSWTDIPEGLEIYFGDDFIFNLQLSQGKKNYLITNMEHFTQFAATTSDRNITAGFLEREKTIYDGIKLKVNDVIAKEVEQQKWLTEETPKSPLAKKRILIAIPTARNIEPDTFKSIYDLTVPEGYETTFQYFFGYNVDQVRNLIADWVVKGFDYLFSVDSDISFNSDTLVKLLSHDKDVVSGLYIQRKPGQHILEIYEPTPSGGVSNMPYGKLKGRPLVEIAGAGFGCVLIKAEVMREIGYPQFEYHSAIDHNNTVSEDVDFCRKARDKGFKLWADPSILCRHTGSSTYNIDTSIEAVETDVKVDIKARLRELESYRLLPTDHINYLAKLKELGVQPKVIFDVGASVLHWTNEAKRVWPDAEFVVFDAVEDCEFLYAERGLKYHIGLLSNETGKELDFYQNDYHPGGNSYYKENSDVNPEASKYFNESHRRRLKSVTLDALVRLKPLPIPDLIKMDVQGAELDVLKGSVETIKNIKHIILELQVVEYNKGAPLRDEVIKYMDEQGFDCLGLFCNNGPDGDYHFVRR
jgi:FkbM family methyltransferase